MRERATFAVDPMVDCYLFILKEVEVDFIFFLFFGTPLDQPTPKFLIS